MRSPSDSTVYFCANCDEGPGKPKSVSSNSTSSSVDSASHVSISRPSTPLTELSDAPSSPTFAPPVDTEEITRRRQQSDLASTEIGKRLLKGWAMLADECPNSQCYGIPLVRPPKAGGEKDPRKARRPPACLEHQILKHPYRNVSYATLYTLIKPMGMALNA
jgi:hypothetical protein